MSVSIIQIILLIILATLIFALVINPGNMKNQAMMRLFFMLFIGMGVIAVIFPDLLNQLAQLLGVGRGADLMLYALIIVYIVDKIRNYHKWQKVNQRIDTLVRRIALDEKED